MNKAVLRHFSPHFALEFGDANTLITFFAALSTLIAHREGWLAGPDVRWVFAAFQNYTPSESQEEN